MDAEAPKKKSFSERFRSKPENAAKAQTARSKARVDRSDYYYVKLHLIQLIELEKRNDPAAAYLFQLLLGASFSHRGKPFELPTERLMQIPGLANIRRLRARLRKLEQWGLISIVARPPRTMLIQVPLAL